MTTHVTGSLESVHLWEYPLSKKIQIASDIASGSYYCNRQFILLALFWLQTNNLLHVDLSLANIKCTQSQQWCLDLGTEQLLYQKPVTDEELQDRYSLGLTWANFYFRAIGFGILLWWLCRTDYDKNSGTYEDAKKYTPANIKRMIHQSRIERGKCDFVDVS